MLMLAPDCAVTFVHRGTHTERGQRERERERERERDPVHIHTAARAVIVSSPVKGLTAADESS